MISKIEVEIEFNLGAGVELVDVVDAFDSTLDSGEIQQPVNRRLVELGLNAAISSITISAIADTSAVEERAQRDMAAAALSAADFTEEQICDLLGFGDLDSTKEAIGRAIAKTSTEQMVAAGFAGSDLRYGAAISFVKSVEELPMRTDFAAGPGPSETQAELETKTAEALLEEMKRGGY